MAEAIVVGAFVSASVELLLDTIVSREFVDFFRNKKLDVSLLEKLKITLLSLQTVLNDAEEKQITDPAVKEWLHMLSDAVFDADNLFDEINTKALRYRVNAQFQSQTVTTKVRSIISSPFKQSYGEINAKMQTLFKRLEHLRAQKLGLKEGVSSSVWHGTPTSSVVDESGIYGRDADRKILKDYLLSEDVSGRGSKIGVVSIVGMGGLGKTTLAKLLYNDHQVKEKFDLKGWAYISKDFDVCKVTKAILESVTSKTSDANNMNPQQVGFFNSKASDTNNLNTLQVELKQSLSHKKFLLVLDDIWDANYVHFNNLKDIFTAGELGSKIIITTRDERVALAMKTFLPIHYLRPLQSEDCWSLLAKHAFGESSNQEHSHLEAIGKQIAKKCDGLPLAAVALGGLLRTNLSHDHWKKVLKSNIWDLEKVEVQPALLLSYHYLPAPLKGCFAYCSIFPKNSELEKKMVVQLWIAEGLVRQSKSERSMEEVGEEYFDELVSRSLIHRRSIDGEATFAMHDLTNDLATTISSAYCVRLDEQKPHESVRHLSYNRGKYDSSNKFDTLCGLKGLRSFLSLPLKAKLWMEHCFISEKVIHDLLPQMKQLRALSLSNYKNITELPNSIENLTYLRYLNLSRTDMKRLPSAICKLYNLQTLLLFECRYLTELPEDIGKLVNLHHLDITFSGVRRMPIQIARLQNLQILSNFVISKERDGLKVTELRKFPNLQGKLTISGLQNVIDPSDACEANLKMKEQIEELTLHWNNNTATTTDDQKIETVVLEHLEPSRNLKRLSIVNYGGVCFPNWLGDSSFGNMVYLWIGNCHRCSSLPPFGQICSLKELFIYNMRSVKSVGTQFYGSSSSSPSFQPFPSLEILSFYGMSEWEEWNLIGGTAIEFPSLRNLVLDDCPKLKGNIPSNFPSLTRLYLSRCPLLLESWQTNNNGNNIIRPSDKLSQLMMSLNSLQSLTIIGFPSLTCFPKDGLPKTLQSLTIQKCPNLEFLPHESLHNYTLLEYLKIESSCDSMTSFTLGSLPVLKFLHLKGCRGLKLIFIAAEDPTRSGLSFLQSIIITFCHELESVSLGGLPAPNIIYLEIYCCDKLKSLPEPIHTLPGLQQSVIGDLPNLESFGRNGLPVNLQGLIVGGISLNTGVSEWSLERLTCLSLLGILGDVVLNALMKVQVPLLPASLVHLGIFHLNYTKCLQGKWLQHLTSLQKLEIWESPSLESLPKEGLPSSLLVLEINGCPLLKASCLRKQGKEWPKIAHIPFIIMDGDKVIL